MSLAFEITCFFSLLSEYAFRRCSENGYWLNQDGVPDTDPEGNGWTNFTSCFSAETLKVLENFYANISGKVYFFMTCIDWSDQGHIFKRKYNAFTCT